MTFDQKLMATRLFFTVYYYSTELSAELTYFIEAFLLSATDTKTCTGYTKASHSPSLHWDGIKKQTNKKNEL